MVRHHDGSTPRPPPDHFSVKTLEGGGDKKRKKIMPGNGSSISTERAWCQVEDVLRNRVTVDYVLLLLFVPFSSCCTAAAADLPAQAVKHTHISLDFLLLLPLSALLCIAFFHV